MPVALDVDRSRDRPTAPGILVGFARRRRLVPQAIPRAVPGDLDDRRVVIKVPWYTQTPKDSGYTAPRVGVAAGAKSKRYPDSEGNRVYEIVNIAAYQLI